MAQNRFTRGAFASLPVEAESPLAVEEPPSYDTGSISSFFEPPRLHKGGPRFIPSTSSDAGDSEETDSTSSSEETLEDFAQYRAIPVAEVLKRRKRTFSIAPASPCTNSNAEPCTKGKPITEEALVKKVACVDSNPLLKRPANPPAKALDAFLYCFEELRYKGPHDQFDARGRFVITKAVLHFTAQNKPIEMILPAFPCKSPSRNKVLGTLPDYAERLALKRLQCFCTAVGSVYPPGCKMIIMGDGRVFADLIGVPDECVDAYISYTKEKLLPQCPSLVWSDLDELLPQASPEATREALVQGYGTDVATMRAEIKASRELAYTYAGFSRFLAHDRDWAAEGVSSKSQVKKRCQAIAREMMCRNRAFSRLIEERYPRHVRLSIHGHPNSGPKFGIRLTRDMPDCVTPWHNCVVILSNSERVLMHKATAEKLQNVALCHLEGQPWCYHELSPEQMEKLLQRPGHNPCEVCSEVTRTTGRTLEFWPVRHTV